MCESQSTSRSTADRAELLVDLVRQVWAERKPALALIKGSGGAGKSYVCEELLSDWDNAPSGTETRTRKKS